MVKMQGEDAKIQVKEEEDKRDSKVEMANTIPELVPDIW